MTTPLVTIHPEVVSGTPVFAGTRMPVKMLYEFLEGNYTVDGFLYKYPHFTRKQVIDVLEHAFELLEQDATKVTD